MIWGNTPRSFPPAFSILGYDVGGTRVLFSPNDTFIVLVVVGTALALAALFQRTTIGLKMRASAFAPEVARMLGVRVGHMFTLGWALAALVGSLAGLLVAPSVFVGPNQFDPILIFGFTAAVLGGLDSPVGAAVGGIILGLALSYVSGYEGSDDGHPGGARDPARGPDDPPRRAVHEHPGAARMTLAGEPPARPAQHAAALARAGRSSPASCCSWPARRSSSFRDLQLASGAYYFAVLAGLTVLTGLSGQISLGHGALMAVGAYTVALLIGNEHWALVPALVAATVVTTLVGALLGAGASRLRGPYLAGATLAFAVGLPAVAEKYSATFGGANGLVINPPTPPASLGASFPLERWEAWIAGAGALVVLFAMNNLVHSGIGRSLRAVRDDEIAASLCGLRVGRVQTLAFVVSAACAGLAGGLLAVVLQLAAPGAFELVAVAVAADGDRARRARLARRRGLGRRRAGPAAGLDERPRPLLLTVHAGVRQPAACDLRASC